VTGARLTGWAWFSKEHGSSNEYAILESSASGPGEDELRQELFNLTPGQPDELSRSSPLPWAVFASTLDGPRLSYRVCWWDWTDFRDRSSRRIAAALYLRIDADGPVSYEGLARYAREAWQLHVKDRAGGVGHPAGLPGDVGARLLDDPDARLWAAAVAALTLCAPVRIARAAREDPEDVAGLFDAVTTLMPGPLVAKMQLTTGITGTSNEPFNIAVGRKPDSSVTAVERWSPPDVSVIDEVADYYATLADLLEHRSVDDIAGHLANMRELPPRLGKQAAAVATRRLGEMDRLRAVGGLLVLERGVDHAEVRDLVAAHGLAGRVPVEMHRAYLRYLLEAGHPEDLGLVAANWTEDAFDLFTDALGAGTDDRWLAAAVPVIVAAGPDRVALTTLTRGDAAGPAAAVVGRLLRVPVPLDRTRQWLLQPPQERAARAAVAADPAAVVPWLAGPSDAPPWAQLLLDALSNDHRTGEPVTDPAWLSAAIRVAQARSTPDGTIVGLLLRDMCASVAAETNESLLAWLESLTGLPDRAQAETDFILLLGRVPPPGLAAGTRYPRDEEYLATLADLFDSVPGTPGARDFLLRCLGDDHATADALYVVEGLNRHAPAAFDRLIPDAARIARERPRLAAELPRGRFREEILRSDDWLRRAVAVLDVERIADRAAPAPELAEALVEAVRLDCDPGRLGPALTRWSGAEEPMLRTLCLYCGRYWSEGDHWEQMQAGLAFLMPMLEPYDRETLAAGFRGEVVAYVEELKERMKDLKEQQERARVLERQTRSGSARSGPWYQRWVGGARPELPPLPGPDRRRTGPDGSR
jgi:hypothetical protein